MLRSGKKSRSAGSIDPGIFRTGLTPGECIELQKRLAPLVTQKWDGRDVGTIAAVDVHFPARDVSRAAVAVLSYPALEPVDSASVDIPCRFPYVPGLLSFREIPSVLASLERISRPIDLILCDGHGLAHPRKLGIASHLGLILDIPAIGCAKSHLFGSFVEPGTDKGDRSPVMGKDGSVIGCVLRTRSATRPVYVSTGHMIDLETATGIVLACCPKYRIPVPLREAHRLAGL